MLRLLTDFQPRSPTYQIPSVTATNGITAKTVIQKGTTFAPPNSWAPTMDKVMIRARGPSRTRYRFQLVRPLPAGAVVSLSPPFERRSQSRKARDTTHPMNNAMTTGPSQPVPPCHRPSATSAPIQSKERYAVANAIATRKPNLLIANILTYFWRQIVQPSPPLLAGDVNPPASSFELCMTERPHLSMPTPYAKMVSRSNSNCWAELCPNDMWRPWSESILKFGSDEYRTPTNSQPLTG